MSDLDWNDPEGKNTVKNYKKNEKVTVVLLGVNYEQERIALGIKQLASENFKKDIQKLIRGYRTPCLIKNVRRDFMEVEIDLGLKGIIKRIDISSEKKDQKTDSFKVGDKIDVNVISFDPKSGKLMLAIKSLDEVDKNNPQEEEDEEFDIEQYMNTDTSTTLGSVFGNMFNNIK